MPVTSSQIAQVLPVQEIATDSPASKVSVSVPDGNDPQECSQDAIKCTGYSPAMAMAP